MAAGRVHGGQGGPGRGGQGYDGPGGPGGPPPAGRGGGIPDGVLVGSFAFLLGLTGLAWSATGLAGLFAHGAWPDGVRFLRTPLALRALAQRPHDLAAAWPDTPKEQLSGYGLFWGLFISELMVLIVLTVFAIGTVTRYRAVRAKRRAARWEAAGDHEYVPGTDTSAHPRGHGHGHTAGRGADGPNGADGSGAASRPAQAPGTGQGPGRDAIALGGAAGPTSQGRPYAYDAPAPEAGPSGGAPTASSATSPAGRNATAADAAGHGAHASQGLPGGGLGSTAAEGTAVGGRTADRDTPGTGPHPAAAYGPTGAHPAAPGTVQPGAPAAAYGPWNGDAGATAQRPGAEQQASAWSGPDGPGGVGGPGGAHSPGGWGDPGAPGGAHDTYRAGGTHSPGGPGGAQGTHSTGGPDSAHGPHGTHSPGGWGGPGGPGAPGAEPPAGLASAPPQPVPTPRGGPGFPGAEAPTHSRVLYGTQRGDAAAQTVLDAVGPVLVVTSDATLWAGTKDARAKFGPTHVFDPSHLLDTPARLRWNPAAGCESRDVAATRATALLAPVRPLHAVDRPMAEAAETMLRCWLHAAAVDSRPFRHVHRWAQGNSAHEPVRILRTHAKAAGGAAGELEATLTAHPERRDMAQQLTARALAALSSIHIRDACNPGRSDTLALESFAGEGGTLYVMGESIEDPRTHPGAMPLLTALASHVVEHGRRMAERSSSGRLDPPLTLVLDDVAAVAPLPQLPDLLAHGASLGLPTLALMRSQEQARARWPHRTLVG
ncbi:hypothetical protein AB0E27_09195 [Streptomyces sparsogenes]|uniref:hypothetical protein n=1 Tax=Streptomyces sparsogenes TaxID=67365 RepID=UPI0034118CC0